MKYREMFFVCVLFSVLITFSKASLSVNGRLKDLIQTNMNKTADPCEDYHEYACGNWVKNPANQNYSDIFGRIDSEINVEYEQALMAIQRSPRPKHHFEQQALIYLKSCLDQEEFEALNYLSHITLRENISLPSIYPDDNVQGDDLDDKNISEDFDWLHVLATFRKYNFNGIFLTEYVVKSREGSSKFSIRIKRPKLYDDFNPLRKWQMERFCNFSGIDEEHKRLRLWNTINEFESKLIQLYDIEDTYENSEEIPLEELCPPKLQRYLEIVLDKKLFDLKMNLTITDELYIVALFRLLKNYDQEFVSRYILVRFLIFLDENGPWSFRKDNCIDSVRSQMPQAMYWIYEKHYPEFLSQVPDVQQIFDQLRQQFLNIIVSNPNNFSDHVVGFLSRKIHGMQLNVGNLPRDTTIEAMETFYKDLKLKESDFYYNHLELLRFATYKEHEFLDRTLPSDAYYLFEFGKFHFSSPTTASFWYWYNRVQMSAAILHIPIYHPKMLDIFKYSLLGATLGHEISHGFDEGRVGYNKYEKIEGIDDIYEESNIFSDHLNCLKSYNPNGVDEKIADVNGLRLAYETYFSDPTRSKTKYFKKPPQELFFESYAQWFCSDPSNSSDDDFIEHGPYRTRLNDAVKNFPEFARVYRCPFDSQMNPVKKCQLW